MTRAILALACLLACGPALAGATPQRAEPGAGWSPVPVLGNSGEQIFHRFCWDCHGDGRDRPGTDALQAKYNGNPPARLDQRRDLTATFVIATVRHGISVMPSMRKTEIGDAELKAIAAYLARNTH